MGKQSTHAPIWSAGVLDTARWEGGAGNRWRPVWHEGSGLDVANRQRCRRVSDRVIVLPRPGNAGGGKGPDFWCVPEDGKGMVIGESLQNTQCARRCRKELCREAKTASDAQSRATTGLVVCFAVKPVGERSAGNPHAAFDERGWETGRCRMAQATAPILDSTCAPKARTTSGGRFHPGSCR